MAKSDENRWLRSDVGDNLNLRSEELKICVDHFSQMLVTKNDQMNHQDLVLVTNMDHIKIWHPNEIESNHNTLFVK